MSAPHGDPAYDPDTWRLGYQSRQFGVAVDPAPTNASDTPLPYPSVYSALATPPTTMTTAIELATGVTQGEGFSSATITPGEVDQSITP